MLPTYRFPQNNTTQRLTLNAGVLALLRDFAACKTHVFYQRRRLHIISDHICAICGGYQRPCLRNVRWLSATIFLCNVLVHRDYSWPCYAYIVYKRLSELLHTTTSLRNISICCKYMYMLKYNRVIPTSTSAARMLLNKRSRGLFTVLASCQIGTS